jgi:5-formyltetrahydrofolate cyclo-ligase
MSEEEKARLRQEGLARRDAEPEREERGRAVAALVRDFPPFRRAGTIAAYVAVRSEVPTLPLLEALWQGGKGVVLPLVTGATLSLVRVRSAAELAPGAFGIPEPGPAISARAERRVQPSEVELFLVPGVAFDRHGGRIGYGKGFYDRLLARARAGAVTVGLAYESQIVPGIPAGPKDVRLRHLVTERQVYTFDRVHH